MWRKSSLFSAFNPGPAHPPVRGRMAGPVVRRGGVDLVTCAANPMALGPGVAPSSGTPPGTYLVRPNDPTLPVGARPNTAYFVMVGNFPGAFDSSINYVNQRNKLALIESPRTGATLARTGNCSSTEPVPPEMGSSANNLRERLIPGSGPSASGPVNGLYSHSAAMPPIP